MSIVRYQPHKLLDFNSLTNLDDFFTSAFQEYKKSPAIDIIDEKNSYIAQIDIPGFEKEDISISIENNILTITGEKTEESTNKNYIRKERKYSKFSRSISLIENVDENNIKASLKNGILEVNIPKKHKKIESRKIIIE